MNDITINGSVRAFDGTALRSATVTLISPQGRQLGRARSDDGGGFAVSAPRPGAYVLIATADGHRPQATALVAGGEPAFHQIVLLGARGLAGLVRAGADGRPVPGAMVAVTDDGGEVLATAKTGENGVFTVDELPDGLFTVAVNASGFRPAALPVEIGAGAGGRIEVTLSSGTNLQGTVRVRGGRRPVRDARVTLVDVHGDVVATATTGEDGTYAFTDLEAGEYTIIASGYPPAATPLALADSGQADHDLRLGHPDE